LHPRFSGRPARRAAQGSRGKRGPLISRRCGIDSGVLRHVSFRRNEMLRTSTRSILGLALFIAAGCAETDRSLGEVGQNNETDGGSGGRTTGTGGDTSEGTGGKVTAAGGSGTGGASATGGSGPMVGTGGKAPTGTGGKGGAGPGGTGGTAQGGAG